MAMKRTGGWLDGNLSLRGKMFGIGRKS